MPLCMGGAGIREFSRPVCEGLLHNTILGVVLPPAVEFFLPSINYSLYNTDNIVLTKL
jgi:hypothetical protein